MGPKNTELASILRELIELLDRYEVLNWSKWMNESLRRIESSDFSGVTHLLNAYGGMGSFNDCILMFHDPNQKKGTSAAKDNVQFNELSSKAYSLATEIKREYEQQ